MPQAESNTASGSFPAAIVWDLDGTLVESAPDLANALNSLLVEQGQHTHAVDKVRTMIGHGVGKLIERGFRAAGSPLSDQQVRDLEPRFMEIYMACATENTYLVKHAREALEHFYHAGVRQGLCTNKPVGVTHQILQKLDIAGFFGSVIGGDSTPEKKPDPLPLQTCLAELGVSADQALMVGDSGADVGAARSAGVPVILVPDGYTGAPAETLGADHVVDSIADVKAKLPPYPPFRQSA